LFDTVCLSVFVTFFTKWVVSGGTLLHTAYVTDLTSHQLGIIPSRIASLQMRESLWITDYKEQNIFTYRNQSCSEATTQVPITTMTMTQITRSHINNSTQHSGLLSAHAFGLYISICAGTTNDGMWRIQYSLAALLVVVFSIALHACFNGAFILLATSLR
jgi:hypothetical protein